MTFRLNAFANVGLDESLLRLVLDEHAASALPRLEKLWMYYRNPLKAIGTGPLPWLGNADSSSRGWYRQAQEIGLPARIVGRAGLAMDDRAQARREVVIENDIAWRVQAMVDFMFGKPVTLLSTAHDENLRRTIEKILDTVWERSGGIGLLQDMALLGHVYGHVDLLLRIDPAIAADSLSITSPDTRTTTLDDAIARAAEAFTIEVIEPTRGVPIADPADYRRLVAYILRFDRQQNSVDLARETVSSTLWRRAFTTARSSQGSRQRTSVTEIFSGSHHQLYHDENLIEQSVNTLTAGQLPIVHIQNVSQPFRYEGQGEVEPLIPLQDELNTRLSDRASRVTMQSFKMYLTKGIEGADKMSVGPGVIWTADNVDASVQEFGGDGHSPSEESHIQEIREALDKVSSVPPLAGGVVRAKIGNLSSANALKITLMGILSKTARKRVTYGRGMAQISRLILTALDAAGVLKTSELDRGIRLEWPDPLPSDTREQVVAAEAKARLGVPHERVLAELGYSPNDPGVQ